MTNDVFAAAHVNVRTNLLRFGRKDGSNEGMLSVSFLLFIEHVFEKRAVFEHQFLVALRYVGLEEHVQMASPFVLVTETSALHHHVHAVFVRNVVNRQMLSVEERNGALYSEKELVQVHFYRNVQIVFVQNMITSNVFESGVVDRGADNKIATLSGPHAVIAQSVQSVRWLQAEELQIHVRYLAFHGRVHPPIRDFFHSVVVHVLEGYLDFKLHVRRVYVHVSNEKKEHQKKIDVCFLVIEYRVVRRFDLDELISIVITLIRMILQTHFPIRSFHILHTI